MAVEIALSDKYKTYPEHIDSGIGWLGKVPKHWERTSFKHLIEMMVDNRGRTPPTYDYGIPLLEAKHIDGTLKYTSTNFDKYIDKAGHVGFIRDDVRENDILFITVGTIGKTCLVPRSPKFVIAQNIVALRTAEHCCPLFLLFWLRSMAARESMLATNKDSILDSIKISDFVQSKLYLPGFIEQKKIANFLDHETVKIDTLIEKQQQLIKLLKEKRQAVISHAVIRGLNLDVPMRDSGVEWLGEVPAHWVVRRLKHTSKLQSGIPKGKDLTGKISISVPMLRVANVQDGYLNLDDVHKMDILPEQLERFSLQNGDVLMNEGGDNDKLGRGAVWKNEIDPCIHQNHVFAIRPYSIEPEWLDLITRASYAKFHFYRVAKQSTNLASISSTNIKETPLVIPPKDERMEIMAYVYRKVDVFKKAEEKSTAQIELLKERRTALISAAVTGKIDVRNWHTDEEVGRYCHE